MSVLAALALGLFLAPQAHATSGNASAWDALYQDQAPFSASHSNAGCQLCHGSSTQNLNPYGSAIAHALQGGGCSAKEVDITNRLMAVEGLDSDGSGYTNIEEINASTQPGWTTGQNALVSRTACNTSTGSETAPNVGTLDPLPGGCTTDAECDNGLFCDGAETCDVGTGNCLSGTPPCQANETCDEASDTCVASTPPKNEFNIMMNYELGMHCTGFEFAYCCVLPPYNSILAQVIKTEKTAAKPSLLEADPNVGIDGLGRPTVVRDPALDNTNNFKKYQLRYSHEAQPRNDGRGKAQTSTLISIVEGNSLLMWNTIADGATKDANGALVWGSSDGATNVMQGNGSLADNNDNYWNAVWNHLYFYDNLEGENTTADVSAEADKIRLGIDVVYPENTGAALHPMGPGVVGAGFDNVLTFSGDTGTVVYTQMKVLENLPVMLTSPRIWEALGLPLTPFEDTLDFFSNPGAVDEETIRPYVKMKAELVEYPSGNAVLDDGEPVIGFGTAPIDIPNCERCHSLGDGPANSAQSGKTGIILPGQTWDIPQMVAAEINFWSAYYGISGNDSDWYSRLKGAAISILAIHDAEHGTSFTTNWPMEGTVCTAGDPSQIGNSCTSDAECDTVVSECTSGPPNKLGRSCLDDNDCSSKKVPGTCEQAPAGDGVCKAAGEPHATRLGHGSVICQRCHADNVIAVVKSANTGSGDLIMPLTEALHNNHKNNPFSDSLGRSGGCQGCHPAHRSDGDMSGYPITELGLNAFAGSDNRDAAGGCFVGRDVHSNPGKDTDGAETPEHLNAVGQWLSANVFRNDPNNGDVKGIWCTNCHSQLGQELWKAENCADLINGVCITNPRAEATLADVAAAVGISEAQAITWLDPKTDADMASVWTEDPGLCDYVPSLFGGTASPYQDGNVATIEVVLPATGSGGSTCTAGDPNKIGSACTVGADCDSGVCTSGRPNKIGDPCSTDGDCGNNHTPGTCEGVGDGVCTEGSGTSWPDCSTPVAADGPDCDSDGTPDFKICGSVDVDGDFSVNILDFCTTPDCVAAAQATLPSTSAAVPVPMSAATDGRDHWLAPGEPHCADCHAAPYVEQSGNITPYPPFNYPRKASLFRYTRGHQDITCQGCHESIHGLYPVTPNIDTTTYAQAASMNTDGSHGPLNCGACHAANADGVIAWADMVEYNGQPIANDFDAAVSWAHTYTDEADPRTSICLNCHVDQSSSVSSGNVAWLQHAWTGRVSRNAMDKVEILQVGHVSGDPDFEDPLTSVCINCHAFPDSFHTESKLTACTTEWKRHLTQGRVAESVWEAVAISESGTTCGW